uniref:DnaJ homolog subfamily C member 13 (Trinotate prediction) n=1 Tax=Myxobolus squamalis TaxID=59785 RepID=A0A6B2GBR9_MYXSQ
MNAVRSGAIQKMAALLERPFAETPQPSAVRARIAGALQYLEQDPMLGIQVSQILSGFPIWRTFKFQKHDLFIENQGNLQISSVPVGVAGYLMAAQNPAPQSHSTASTIKYLLNSAPPPPTDDDATEG